MMKYVWCCTDRNIIFRAMVMKDFHMEMIYTGGRNVCPLKNAAADQESQAVEMADHSRHGVGNTVL